MAAVDLKNVSFSYGAEAVLRDVSLTAEKGELTVILGCNGSGKTTLLRHLNGLVPLQDGALTVAGIDLRDEGRIWEVRRRCGMVFQNPDNQFVSSPAGEDAAFGLRNFGVPQEEIPARVSRALELTGLTGFESRAPRSLSGGQKQRLALAGVLALEPDILLLDEATSMLDPAGRREVLELIGRLRRERRQTVVLITHDPREALEADRVYVLQGGRMAACGTPREILTDAEALEKAGLEAPPAVALYRELRAAGIDLGRCPLTERELADAIAARLPRG